MNILKEKLRNNEVTIGTWLQMPSPALAGVLASEFEWVCVDLEHGDIGLETAADMFRAIKLRGSVPIARVPANDRIWIKRLLDAGAEGLVIPNVNSVDDIMKIVAAKKYPKFGSLGTRGYGFCEANNYGKDFDRYIKNANNIPVIIQIEHKDAFEKLDELFKCAKIHCDASMIGPYDLSGSLNNPGGFETPEFKKLLREYIEISNDLEFPCGMHIVYPDKNSFKIAKHSRYRFIAMGTESTLIRQAVKSFL